MLSSLLSSPAPVSQPASQRMAPQNKPGSEIQATSHTLTLPYIRDDLHFCFIFLRSTRSIDQSIFPLTCLVNNSPNKILRSFPPLDAKEIIALAVLIVRKIPEPLYAELIHHAK